MAEGTRFDWDNDILLFDVFFVHKKMAEGTRFELAILSYAGFQDQCLKPLGHPSTSNYTISRKNSQNMV